MTMALSQNDYKKILKYYDMAIPSKSTSIKTDAEKVILDKLCRCIKKVSKTPAKNSISIGVCKSSVLTSKRLKINRFRCKNTRKLYPFAGTKNKLQKKDKGNRKT